MLSLFQWKLCASPQAGLIPTFKVVSCFHLPMGPAQTSGGVLADWRITAVTDASCEKDALGDGAVPMNSSPVQMVCTRLCPAPVLTLARPELPSIFCAKMIRSGLAHVNEDCELLIFGVRLRTLPRAAGTT